MSKDTRINGGKPPKGTFHEELDQICGSGVWEQIQKSNFRYYERMTNEEFEKWCELFEKSGVNT